MMKVERHGDDVSVLRMDDGKVNAIGLDFATDFHAAWTEAASGRRAIVLTGNARTFCAGLDVKALARMREAEIADLARGFGRTFRAPLAHGRPVVAFVNGPAIAGGAVLALACDARISAPEARMGITEVPVGVPFPKPVLELARHRLPPQEHAGALLQGAVRPGNELVARGWSQAEGDLASAVALARELASSNPVAYADAKAQLNAPLVAAWDAFEKEADGWAAALQTNETKAALARTVEKLSRR